MELWNGTVRTDWERESRPDSNVSSRQNSLEAFIVGHFSWEHVQRLALRKVGSTVPFFEKHFIRGPSGATLRRLTEKVCW